MGVTATPIRRPLVRTTPLVQSRSDLCRHLPRLSHHVIERRENRFEFVISQRHDPIVGASLSVGLVSCTSSANADVDRLRSCVDEHERCFFGRALMSCARNASCGGGPHEYKPGGMRVVQETWCAGDRARRGQQSAGHSMHGGAATCGMPLIV